MNPGNPKLTIGLIVLFALVIVFSVPFFGSASLSFSDVFISTEDETNDSFQKIFWQLRMPRVLLGFLAGAALSISGMVFQAVFRNPLATPFTLGVSSGAALGATISITLGTSFTFLGISTISLFAFAGAFTSLIIVYGISAIRGSLSTAGLLLAGVAVSLFCSSLILFIQYISGLSNSFRILRWLMGGIEIVGYESIVNILPLVIIGTFLIFLYLRELNLLSIDEEFAVSKGVASERTKVVLFVATTLMVSGIVSLCGPIGFVGMIVPHICRALIGADHRYLFFASFFFGGAFLTICDTFARLIVEPVEIPVGIITALLGGPFFIGLLIFRFGNIRNVRI